MNGCADGERRKLKLRHETRRLDIKRKELYPPLKEWLNGQGYKVYTEILNMDVVAKK